MRHVMARHTSCSAFAMRSMRAIVRPMLRACIVRAWGPKRFSATTNSSHDLSAAANLPEQDFNANARTRAKTRTKTGSRHHLPTDRRNQASHRWPHEFSGPTTAKASSTRCRDVCRDYAPTSCRPIRVRSAAFMNNARHGCSRSGTGLRGSQIQVICALAPDRPGHWTQRGIRQ
jgi:hypothetical protein